MTLVVISFDVPSGDVIVTSVVDTSSVVSGSALVVDTMVVLDTVVTSDVVASVIQIKVYIFSWD